MTIGIDLTKTNIVSPVGTDVYTIEVTKALVKGNFGDEFILLTTGRGAHAFWQQTLGQKSNYKIVVLPVKLFITQLGVMLATWKYRQIAVLWEPVPTLPLLHRPGLKLVVTIHGELDNSLSLAWSVKYADTIIVVSEATKMALVKMFGQQRVSPPSLRFGEVKIIPEGVDASVFYPRSREEVNNVRSKYSLSERYFLFVGTISPRKNLVNLIGGFAKYLDVGAGFSRPQSDSDDRGAGAKKAPLRLVIAGNVGQQAADSLAAPAKYGVMDRVKFIGRIETTDLPALYSGAVATCLISHEEGFGLPIIESLACGTPVVVSAAVGVIGSIDGIDGIGDIVTVIDSESVESIASGLEKVAPLEDGEEVCQKCLTVAKGFSWEKAAESLLKQIKM